MLTTAGQNIDRFHSEASFAAICGASPNPASSEKTIRHRLNPGGDRQANRALHLSAVCRLRYCQRTRADAKRRTREGKTQREIMRCLKRYIARRSTTPSSRTSLISGHGPPQRMTAIHCGNPGHGITRKRT
jgi:transposase